MKKLVFIMIMILALSLTSCLEGPHPLLPELKTLEPTDISFNSVVLRGMAGTEKDEVNDEHDSYSGSIEVKFIIADNADFDPDGWTVETRERKVSIGREFSETFYGLEAEKTYYYKMVYAGGGTPNKDVDYLWNVISFKTPDYTALKVGNAVLEGTDKSLNVYNCNFVFTSGTMSSKKEEYLNCKASNGVVTPEIIVKNSGLKGTMYSFAEYSSKYGSVGYYPTTSVLNVIDAETLYFKKIDPRWNLYVGSSEDFNSTQKLRSAMAEIEIKVSRRYGEQIYIRLDDLTKSNKIFTSGWLNLSTGKWTIDKDASQQADYLFVVDDDGKQGNYSLCNFYTPPMEFGTDELRFSSSYGNLTLPAGKWEAGKKYSYIITK